MRVTARIEPVNQAAVVSIALPMLSTALTLRTDWSAGRVAARTWAIHDAAPGEAVEVTVAGRTTSVTADEQGVATFVWDGTDVTGASIAKPSIAHAVVGGQKRRMRLGRWDPITQGLGGPMLLTDDHLDTVQRRIHSAHGRLLGNVRVTRAGEWYGVTRDHGHVGCWFDDGGGLVRVEDTRTGEVLRQFDRGERGLRSVTAGPTTLTVTRHDGSLSISDGLWAVDATLGGDGRATRLTDPSGRGVRLRWDEQGLLVGVTDASGFEHHFEYDDLGRIVAFTEPGRGPLRLVRIATEHGTKVTALSAEGRESSYQTDRLPNGTKVRTTRCCGDQPTVTRIDGATITVERPDGTRIINDRGSGERRTVRPSGSTRSRTVRRDATVVNGDTYRTEHGPAATVVTSPLDHRFEVRRTEGGTRISAPAGTVELVHDGAGRLARVVRSDVTMTISRDERGLPTVVDWSTGARIGFEHDASGWLTAQHLTGGRAVQLDRDGGGLVRSVTNPAGETTAFTYGAPGRLDTVRFPAIDGDEELIEFAYDRDGLLVGRRVNGGEPVLFDVGAGGELEAVRRGDAVATREYEHGQLVTGRTPDGHVLRVERDGPLVTAITHAGHVHGTLRFDHDDRGRRTSVSSGPLTAAFSYDADGRVTDVGSASLAHDDAGRLVAVTAGVVEQRFHHDEHGRPAGTTLVVDGATLWEVSLERDDLGRISRLTDTRLPSPVEYAYDDAHRLVGANGGLDDITITHGPNGTPNSVRRDGAEHAATVAPGDQLVALGETELAHGPGGTVTAIDGRVVLRDLFDRVTAVEGPDGRTSVRRDVLGAIVVLQSASRSAQRFLPAPYGRPQVVLGPDDQPQLLLAGGDASSTPLVGIAGDRTLLLACDHLGSVRLVLDTATGEVVEARDYDVWGRRVIHEGAPIIPYGFAGGLDDPSTGLVHFPARSYSPALMRWLRRDPELFLGGGANLYAYANGDPVNHRDPTGRKVEICRRKTDILPGFVPGSDNAEHWWIRTDDVEAGMTGDPAGMTSDSVVVGDHEGAGDLPGSECDEVPMNEEEEACVTAQLQMNKRTGNGFKYGEWLGKYGLGNTCQNFVDRAISACTNGQYSVETTDPDAYDNWYTPDVETHWPSQPYTPADDGGYTPHPDHTPADGGSLWE